VIRSELDVLLDKVRDEALRADLKTQIDRLKERRSYGLVFERHIPERVRLPLRQIRVGSRVASRDGDDNPTWEVVAIDDGKATLATVRDAVGAYVKRGEHGDLDRAPIDSLVVISEFGEPVLPGLRHLGSVERGGDKPYHVVIKGENHHALEALRFTHAGKVDCIYIDPPYNSGARDWKYNNDYVDQNDAYRHSKWLAFMERRLKLAKDLLNPDDSVLIVTIDEREYLRLGMLLEELFRGARITMVTSSINSAGATRKGTFPRASEYIYFVQHGESRPVPLDLGSDWNPVKTANKLDIYWSRLIRSGADSARADSVNQFYPVFIRPTNDGPVFDSIGDRYFGSVRDGIEVPADSVAVWPIRDDGTEGRWRVSAAVLRELLTDGHARLGSWRGAKTTVYYLKQGERQKVSSGLFQVTGRRQDGSLVTDSTGYRTRFVPTDIWRITSHDAGNSGSRLTDRFIPGRMFPFPKSLYAVEDTIRFFVKYKPNAVVLDFFAGSGTTTHAVMRLNRQDGGRRQSIMVTNNEVSVEEAAELRKRGFRPGDAEWEALGIFEHITRPRVEAAVTGKTPDGEPIKGDYKFTDEFPMAEGFEENVEFLELNYLQADDVDLGLAFDDLAALLWLRAGAKGRIVRSTDDAGKPLPYGWTDQYGVIFDTDQWRAFVSKRPDSAQTAFIATYSPAVFASIAAELPAGMDVVRLYDSYLSRFMPERAAG